jgi:hypothetical protein
MKLLRVTDPRSAVSASQSAAGDVAVFEFGVRRLDRALEPAVNKEV